MKAKTAMKIFMVVIPAIAIILWKAMSIFSDKGLTVNLPYLPGLNLENILFAGDVKVAVVIRTSGPRRKTSLCAKARVLSRKPVPVHTSH